MTLDLNLLSRPWLRRLTMNALFSLHWPRPLCNSTYGGRTSLSDFKKRKDDRLRRDNWTRLCVR